MHLHFERIEKPSSYSDSNILSLSWMGKVPDGLLQNQDDDGWKLNRSNYYQDGWIALGNTKSIVGVTYTTCKCRKASIGDLPPRTNYNLRGHRSEVILTRWNEPYQKLASCDSSGIIFVWIKFEGRWSIELINDRNTQVTDFCWSHDGRMALICYVDGFVLIGSVAGQRYWSSMLNLESCSTTCCIWSPNDQQVMFGTSSGHIMVIDINGTLVAEISVRESFNIVSMCWSCEKFKMEDTEDNASLKSNNPKNCILAVAFIDGTLYLMKNYDDLFPVIINTRLQSLKIEWSNKAEILAVGGHRVKSFAGGAPTYVNTIQFYTELGTLRYTVNVDSSLHPITALTWGHNDKRLFVATGPVLHIAWITKRVPTLQLLSRLSIYRVVPEEKCIAQLPLPSRLQTFVSSLFGKTLRCYLPDMSNLRNFVSYAPPSEIRLHCTLIRHEDDIVGSSATYVLYLEYLGGLVPILKGKRASKLRPEFVIFDPQHLKSKEDVKIDYSSSSSSHWNSSSNTATSESEGEDPLVSDSPVTRSRRARRIKRKSRREREQNAVNELSCTKPENGSYDDLPEDEKLVLVTSNIWGTKFKLLGLVAWLPSELGSLTYRTSLLHLQPRQMTLCIKELGGSRKNSCTEKTVVKNETNVFSSEDEEESNFRSNHEIDFNVPIAPMTPKKTFRHQNQNGVSPERRTSLFARSNESITPPSYIPSYSDYVQFVPSSSEELLTLQINGDGNGNSQVTMELSRSSHPGQNFSHATSSSISTQTSFQSVTELLNLMSMDRKSTKPEESESPFSPDLSTEEVFSRMAKKFSSELPCSSRTPASQSLAFTKYDILQNTSISDNCDKHLQISSSPVNSPPNMSPPKTFRHKVGKLESPRRSSVSCFERSELNGINSSGSSLYTNSTGSQIRFGGSSGSNWGPVTVCQRGATTAGDTCLFDSKQLLFQATTRDIKYIDDNDTEENPESVTFQNRFVKSPSFLLYRNKPVSFNHSYQPIAAVNSDFTNIRANADYNSHQRRLTLRTNRSSFRCDSGELGQHLPSATTPKDKPTSCMLLDEETEDKEVLDDMPCCCVNDNEDFKCGEKGCTKNVESLADNRRTFNLVSRESSFESQKGAKVLEKGRQDKQNECIINSFRSQSAAKTATSTIFQPRRSLPQNVSDETSEISSIIASNSFQMKNRSLPGSPLLTTRRKAQGKGLFYSPTNFRKVMKQKLNYFDCSSEDDNTSDDGRRSGDFKDLESFQKAHIKRKIKVKRRGSRIQPDETSPNKSSEYYEEFLLHNKAPLWNEVSQVYQLDFGGRVTQESAKNFQIEHQGKQVMQFGRIDGNAYTLDFQYPFSALQALAVALANVTQRLK